MIIYSCSWTNIIWYYICKKKGGIEAGEELIYDYGYTRDPAQTPNMH